MPLTLDGAIRSRLFPNMMSYLTINIKKSICISNALEEVELVDQEEGYLHTTHEANDD